MALIRFQKAIFSAQFRSNRQSRPETLFLAAQKRFLWRHASTPSKRVQDSRPDTPASSEFSRDYLEAKGEGTGSIGLVIGCQRSSWIWLSSIPM